MDGWTETEDEKDVALVVQIMVDTKFVRVTPAQLSLPLSTPPIAFLFRVLDLFLARCDREYPFSEPHVDLGVAEIELHCKQALKGPGLLKSKEL